MNSRSILIGTVEMKRPYQRNLAVGFFISGVAHFSVVGAILLAMALLPKPAPIEFKPAPDGPINIRPPVINRVLVPEGRSVNQTKANPGIGIPSPVPEDEAPPESDVPTQNELSLLAPETPPEMLESGIETDPSALLNEILPGPGDFIPVEQMPVQVNLAKPKYPDLACRAGIEGTVWIKALVDREGRVRDAVVFKASGANAGFEEAAIEAALESVWSPAIANGLPIAVWITYRVEFKLK